MCPPPNSQLTALQLAIARALQGKSLPPKRNALADLFDIPPKPTNNALAELLFKPTTPPPALKASDVFGNPYPGNLGFPSAGALALFGRKTRHTFYSFHFDDVMRVNQIRMCDQFRTTDKRTPRVVDRSLWEQAKRTHPAALSSMIDRGLEGTSTTCVLAGTQTWSREWVRYEIARSLERGNGLLTVFIHNCPCPRNGRAAPGHNPLDFIALSIDRQIYELVAGGWKPYGRIRNKLSAWPKWLRPVMFGEFLVPLSQSAARYDWVAQDGSRNLIHWTDEAAAAAGR